MKFSKLVLLFLFSASLLAANSEPRVLQQNPDTGHWHVVKSGSDLITFNLLLKREVCYQGSSEEVMDKYFQNGESKHLGRFNFIDKYVTEMTGAILLTFHSEEHGNQGITIRNCN